MSDVERSMLNERSALRPSIAECASLACAWEVLAPKPGNVHRSADFESTTLQDFVTSAIAIGPVMGQAEHLDVGELVLGSVEATARWVADNTNLGLILLLAPLAKAAASTDASIGSADVRRVLSSLDERDARLVYRAIQIAKPGGLGSSTRWDVADEPPPNLLEAMRLAKDRDSIAWQYCNGFEQVFEMIVPRLVVQLQAGRSLAGAIVSVHVQSMAEIPDTLIARKCGKEVAIAAAARADRVLQFDIDGPDYLAALDDLDFWLRADGNRRNPGTTADLIGAGLFVALRNGMIQLPVR